jgi:hypothetical protein
VSSSEGQQKLKADTEISPAHEKGTCCGETSAFFCWVSTVQKYEYKTMPTTAIRIPSMFLQLNGS